MWVAPSHMSMSECVECVPPDSALGLGQCDQWLKQAVTRGRGGPLVPPNIMAIGHVQLPQCTAKLAA